MTSTSDGLAAALAVWPLDREQRSLVREATAGIDERQARALRTLLLEAESAVITCANLLRADAQSQQRPYGRQQPTREERRSERRPGRDLAKTTARKAADDELLKMTTEVVAGYVGNNALPPYQLPELVSLVYSSLRALGGEAAEASAEPIKPAVPIRKSITADYLICLEDGKKLKMLKRHLRSTYNMSPEDYRAKWGLPTDYPMVAPNYAEQRSELAKKMGLGRSTLRREARRSVR